jgi:transcriptional regulator with XRE-family HTH domain
VFASILNAQTGDVPESAPDNFRRRIRQLRERRGWSQEKAGEVCGLGEKMFQLYELGIKDNPGLRTVEKIARGLGVEAWELLTPEPPKRKR